MYARYCHTDVMTYSAVLYDNTVIGWEYLIVAHVNDRFYWMRCSCVGQKFSFCIEIDANALRQILFIVDSKSSLCKINRLQKGLKCQKRFGKILNSYFVPETKKKRTWMQIIFILSESKYRYYRKFVLSLSRLKLHLFPKKCSNSLKNVLNLKL